MTRRGGPWATRGRLQGVVLVVVVLLLAAGGAAYARTTSRHDGSVEVPRATASPREVVRAYLAALDSHDCRTAQALVTDGERVRTTRWCEDVAALHDVRVRGGFSERPEWSGRTDAVEVWNVPVRFDLDLRAFRGDGTLPEGPTMWGYLLARPTGGGPWRIADAGVG